MQATDLEQRNRGLALAVVEHPACHLSSPSETSGLSVSVKWSVGRGPEQSGSGIVTRLESLGNLEKRRRVVLGGHALERDDVRRGERARKRRQKRRVRQAVVGLGCIYIRSKIDLCLILSLFSLAEKTAEDPPAKLLDDLFRKTKAAPCIYWLPLTEEQVRHKPVCLLL